jgi:hypothetical protein
VRSMNKELFDAQDKSEEGMMKFASAMKEVNWDNAEDRRAVALTFLKFIKLDVQKDNLVPLIADVEQVPVGATPQWVVRKGIKAYVHEPGTYAPRSHITQITNTIASEMVSVHPEMEIEQLAAGRYGTVADIRNMVKEELLGRRYATIWNTLINSVSASDSNYGTYAWNASNQAKKDVLVSGLKWVNDIGNGAKAIVGRYSLVADIVEFGGYAETTKSKIDNQGYLGSFRGVPIVALNQYTDGYGIRRINADNIIIVSKGTTKLAETQPLKVKEAVDINDLMWHQHYYEKYGVSVFFPEKNFRIAVSGSNPWG